MIATISAARSNDGEPPSIAAVPAHVVDIVVDASLWRAEPAAEAIVTRAIVAAAGSVAAGAVEVAVLLTDDAHIRALNRDFRRLDKPTNVLSFPAAPAAIPDAPRALGDIAIAFETTRVEAEAAGKPLAHHLSHLAVHGFLHLIGHDHETDAEAEAMEALERRILAGLGIPDPYATCDGER
jgi:probable rRNA maturation factor